MDGLRNKGEVAMNLCLPSGYSANDPPVLDPEIPLFPPIFPPVGVFCVLFTLPLLVYLAGVLDFLNNLEFRKFVTLCFAALMDPLVDFPIPPA